jgi:hypothetical protein
LKQAQAEVENQRKLRREQKEEMNTEQQLMASAFYGLGQQLHVLKHVTGKERVTGPASGKSPHRNSWLNRQRRKHSSSAAHH